MFSFQSLLNKIQTSTLIDFGDLFNESLELFKKVWVQGLLLQLFSILIMLPFIISFYLPYFNIVLENSSNGVMDSVALSQALIDEYGASLVWIYLLMLVVSLVSSLLYLGFYKIIKAMDHGNSVVISDFFYFFKTPNVGKALGLLLAYLGITILAALLCLFPLVYAIVPLMFMLPVFVYNSHLSISEVIRVAFSLGNKKWSITFLTLVLNSILLYVIILVTCGLGSLFFSFFLYLPQYIIYKKVIGFEAPESAFQEIDS
jgi:L-fucose mutarotase/ribose pyranase (RbsD/FucU family)